MVTHGTSSTVLLSPIAGLFMQTQKHLFLHVVNTFRFLPLRSTHFSVTFQLTDHVIQSCYASTELVLIAVLSQRMEWTRFHPRSTVKVQGGHYLAIIHSSSIILQINSSQSHHQHSYRLIRLASKFRSPPPFPKGESYSRLVSSCILNWSGHAVYFGLQVKYFLWQSCTRDLDQQAKREREKKFKTLWASD